MLKRSEAKRIQELEEALKRALADYSNFQKRVEAEKEKIVNFGKIEVLRKFLGLLDTLEAIEKHEKSQEIKLALAQFRKILEEEKIEEIDNSGHFDPDMHEAVEVVETDKKNSPTGEGVQVLQKGYRFGNSLLRPAKVKVFKKQA